VVDAYSKPYASKATSLIIPKVIATVMVVAAFTIAKNSGTIETIETKLRPPMETAIFMECTMSTLPILPPAGGAAHIVLLNKKRINGLKGQNWGFYEVYQEWPDKSLIKKAEQLHDFGIWCTKCRVSNHGTTNLIYLGVNLDLWLGEGGGEKNKIRYVPVISALDSGKDFEFYLVNDCNMEANAVWQETARAQVLGESKQRDIPLRRTYRSPIDQIIMFFPTTVNWSGQPCQ
jgi:hypothetical protein